MRTAVYIADTDALENPEIYDRLYRLLSAERKEKADWLKKAADRRLSVGAGALLLYALSGILPETSGLRFAVRPGGKPYLPDHPDLHFNLSHSGHYAVCVVSESEAGCDVEELRERTLPVAKRFFTEEEQAYVFSRHGKDRQVRAFFRIWTMKESFVKMRGDGLKLPLTSFSVVPENRGCLFTAPGGEENPGPRQEAPVFYEYRKLPGYACSVCLAGASPDRPVFRLIDLKEAIRETV